MSLHCAGFTPSAEQLEIIEHTQGHAIVGAVAGSGKSQTLVERVARLVEGGSPYDRILVLMFNVAAAEEFTRRLALRMPHLPCPQVMTFHSFGQSLCQMLERKRLLERAVLLDEQQAQQLGREVLIRLSERTDGGKHETVTNEAIEALLTSMDILKGAMYDGNEVPAAVRNEIPFAHVVAFPEFERARARRNARLFGDLVCDPIRACELDSRVRKALQGKFDHVIVDEYQDINDAQMALTRMIAGDTASVMAVGDEDQTIYTWRGARPEYMVSLFEDHFPAARRFALTRTFRYGHALSLMANAVITQNTMRTDKLCISAPTCPVTSISLRMHPDDGNSGDLVAEELRTWVASGRKYSEAAILVRQFSSAVPIEVALRKKRIPFRLVGTQSFVDKPEVLALRMYLFLAAKKGRFPSQWGAVPRSAMIRAALTVPNMYLRREALDGTIETVVMREDVSPASLRMSLEGVDSSVGGCPVGIRAVVLNAMRWAFEQDKAMPAEAFLREVVRMSGIMAYLSTAPGSPEHRKAKMQIVRSVIAYAKGKSVAELHAELASISGAEPSEADHTDSVLITSIHRAKGLDWPCVLMPELVEGVFPANDSSLEDERRLFYVGATRAKERLVLVSPFDRSLVDWARSGQVGVPAGMLRASRFLYESNLVASLQHGMALSAGDGAAVPQSPPHSLIERYCAQLSVSV